MYIRLHVIFPFFVSRKLLNYSYTLFSPLFFLSFCSLVIHRLDFEITTQSCMRSFFLRNISSFMQTYINLMQDLFIYSVAKQTCSPSFFTRLFYIPILQIHQRLLINFQQWEKKKFM